MKKRIGIYVIGLLSMVALVSCGKKNKTTTVITTTSTTPTETITPETPSDNREEREQEEDHTFQAVTYTWNSDNTKVTAKRVCASGDHTETETVNATKNYALEEAKVKYTYTSQAFTNTAFTVQTKTESVDLTGLRIDSTNCKCIYKINEEYSSSNIKVYAVCNNLEIELTSTQYNIDSSKVKNNEAKSYVITVSYYSLSNTYDVYYFNNADYPLI